jgi:hypothetical protein
MHAFPSPQDARSLWEKTKPAVRRLHPLAILSLPVIVLIYAGHVGSMFWLDYVYGIAIGLGIPELVLKKLT